MVLYAPILPSASAVSAARSPAEFIKKREKPPLWTSASSSETHQATRSAGRDSAKPRGLRAISSLSAMEKRVGSTICRTSSMEGAIRSRMPCCRLTRIRHNCLIILSEHPRRINRVFCAQPPDYAELPKQFVWSNRQEAESRRRGRPIALPRLSVPPKSAPPSRRLRRPALSLAKGLNTARPGLRFVRSAHRVLQEARLSRAGPLGHG